MWCAVPSHERSPRKSQFHSLPVLVPRTICRWQVDLSLLRSRRARLTARRRCGKARPCFSIAPDAFAPFLDRRVGKADHGTPGQSPGDVNLNLDKGSFHCFGGASEDLGQHIASSRRVGDTLSRPSGNGPRLLVAQRRRAGVALSPG